MNAMMNGVTDLLRYIEKTHLPVGTMSLDEPHGLICALAETRNLQF